MYLTIHNNVLNTFSKKKKGWEEKEKIQEDEGEMVKIEKYKNKGKLMNK